MRPEHAITVTTFAEFRDDVQAFAAGKYNFLIVIGNNGLSKTESVTRAVECPLIIEGQPTAWKFYQELCDHLDSTVILDDVASPFYRNSTTLAYLKKLTETIPVKTLRWLTDSAGEDKDYPTSFETTSRVVILTNSWESVNEHVRAIEGRAFIIMFDPDPVEVHREVGTWFWDEEVYDFVWEHLRLITKPNMRLYVKIAEQKKAGRPWRKRGLEMIVGNERLNKIAQLLADDNFNNNTERCERFIELNMGKRATFYNLMKEFRFYKTITSQNGPPRLTKT